MLIKKLAQFALDLAFKLRKPVHQLQKCALSNRETFNILYDLIDELIALMIYYLVASNIWVHAELPSVIYFVIDSVANLIPSLLNEKHLAAFIHLICYNLSNIEKPILKIIHKLRHKITVNIVLESVEWKWKFVIAQLGSSIGQFQSFIFYKADECLIFIIFSLLI